MDLFAVCMILGCAGRHVDVVHLQVVRWCDYREDGGEKSCREVRKSRPRSPLGRLDLHDYINAAAPPGRRGQGVTRAAGAVDTSCYLAFLSTVSRFRLNTETLLKHGRHD